MQVTLEVDDCTSGLRETQQVGYSLKVQDSAEHKVSENEKIKRTDPALLTHGTCTTSSKGKSHIIFRDTNLLNP